MVTTQMFGLPMCGHPNWETSLYVLGSLRGDKVKIARGRLSLHKAVISSCRVVTIALVEFDACKLSCARHSSLLILAGCY